jgi:hypothetical protein
MRPTEVFQRRFGNYEVGQAVSTSGKLNATLFCHSGDSLPALLGKILELRDAVVLNPGGVRTIAAFGVDSRNAWRKAQTRAGNELSRCLRLVLSQMPSFDWAEANVAAARIGLSEAQLADRVERRDEADQIRDREESAKQYLSSASTRLDRLLQRRPGFILGRLLRAEVMALSGATKEAEAQLTELEQNGIESSHVQAWLGFLAYQAKAPTAVDRFKKAVGIDSDDDDAAYARYALRFIDREKSGTRTRSDEPQVLMYPPFLRADLPRKPSAVTHFHMRLAVLNFVDQTHLAADLERVLADRLTTELIRGGRFELYDRGQLRARRPTDAAKAMQQGRDLADAIVMGAITQVNYKERRAQLELRAVAARDGLVLFSKRYSIGILAPDRRIDKHKHEGDRALTYELEGTHLFGVDDESLKQMSLDLHEALPRVGDGRVAELTPTHVIIGKGSRDKVFRGMSAYVEAMQDDLVDPKAPGGSVSTGVYVGQLHIFSVEPNRSHGLCYRNDGHPCVLRVGDLVRFK